jgi:glucose-6-phosphate 1-dehydrogenase
VTTLVLFGSTGDVVAHKILPALQSLVGASDLSTIVYSGRRPFQLLDYQQYIQQKAGLDFSTLFNSGVQQVYIQDDLHLGQVPSLESFLALHLQPDTRLILYCAVAPDLYIAASKVVAALHSMHSNITVVLEKPIGRNGYDARRILSAFTAVLAESDIYCVDHYLGKETVQNIVYVRSQNPLFSSQWDKRLVREIQITAAESVGIRERGASYDSVGATRDFLQNHVLQLAAMAMMPVSSEMSYAEISAARLEILRSLQPDMDSVVLGQYIGYLDEPGVAPDSSTETYVSVDLYSNLLEWQGVPIRVRTGKAIQPGQVQVQVIFGSALASQILSFHVQPEEALSLSVVTKTPGDTSANPVHMEYCYKQSSSRSAYACILHDVLSGDHMHSVSTQEVLASWAVVDTLLARQQEYTLHEYAQGSVGPGDGVDWYTRPSTQCYWGRETLHGQGEQRRLPERI